MGLLHEIQEALTEPDGKLGPVLLKLRLLADRIGSDELEEWVRHESEGYPNREVVPEYRQVGVSYTVSYHNLMVRAQHQPVPPHLIEKYAGAAWNQVPITESIATIESYASNEEAAMGIECGNLVLVLQDKIYPGTTLASVDSRLNGAQFPEIINTVRSRVLDLTIKLEREVPGIRDVTIGEPLNAEPPAQEAIQRTVQTIVQGGNATIYAASGGSKITVSNVRGDSVGVRNELTKAGVPNEEAQELADILASETPDKDETPLGNRAREWLARAIGKGAWKIGLDTLSSLATRVAARYYGMD